ncbi:Gamma-butyrobetaine dioxygenase, partial [Branchiostoma belcheri]
MAIPLALCRPVQRPLSRQQIRKPQEGVRMERVSLNEAGHSRVVEVEWSDGGVSRFPYVWLRDNCQ